MESYLFISYYFIIFRYEESERVVRVGPVAGVGAIGVGGGEGSTGPARGEGEREGGGRDDLSEIKGPMGWGCLRFGYLFFCF